MLVSLVFMGFVMFISGTHFWAVIDVPSIIPIIVAPFILSTIGFGMKRSKLAFSAAFCADSTVSDLKGSIAYFNSVFAYMTSFSVFLLVIGWIGLLTGMPYPSEAAEIGSNVSISIVSIFTGAFGAIIFILPFRTAAASRLAELEAE